MYTARDALAIIGANALLARGNIEQRRIKLGAKCYGEGFAEPFEAGRRGGVFEGNYNERATDNRVRSGAKRND
jgi:hypothetical protein